MSGRLEEVLTAIDQANAEDPNRTSLEGKSIPSELIYGQRMTAWLDRFAPDASDALKIAARGQHIRRWSIPRSDYPMDRSGYLKWRTTLYRFHADQLEPLMRAAGYQDEDVQRTRGLVEKRGLKTNAETQTLEDVICLVFLEFYFYDFLVQHPRGKVIDIAQKTWGKMSERGHEHALQLPLSDVALSIVKEALGLS